MFLLLPRERRRATAGATADSSPSNFQAAAAIRPSRLLPSSRERLRRLPAGVLIPIRSAARGLLRQYPQTDLTSGLLTEASVFRSTAATLNQQSSFQLKVTVKAALSAAVQKRTPRRTVETEAATVLRKRLRRTSRAKRVMTGLLPKVQRSST